MQQHKKRKELLLNGTKSEHCLIFTLLFLNKFFQNYNFYKIIQMEINYPQDDRYNQTDFKNLQSPHCTSSFIQMNRIKNRYEDSGHVQKLVNLNKRKKKLKLKDLVTKTKVDILKKNFVRKIKRGKVYREIPDNLGIQKEQNVTFITNFIKILQQTQGLELSPIMLCLWCFVNIIQISVMIIIFSLMITFPETQSLEYFGVARVLSLVIYFFDMVLNFLTQRFEIGGHKKNLKDIIKFYLKNQFMSDFFSIISMPLSYIVENDSTITLLILIIAVLKLKNNIRRFQNYEFIYVKNNSRQHYYSLIKIFLLNFSIGHILSILLNLMATLSNNDQNWYKNLNIGQAEWYQKYIWGYYWGTNIMLTVGFGDLCASNTTQAGLLIFIETLGCITLAYNINCVGSIIGKMKAENQEKKKKLKYFHRMCQGNKVSQQLEHKITNFIEESYLIKEQFQLQQYEQVINSLPKTMQSEYYKQANKSLFDVGFFNSLNNKTILKLAEFVIRKVAHPQEIIQKRCQIQNFCILQKGCLGFTCRNGPKSLLNGIVIEKIQTGKEQNCKILSLGFIKRKILSFDIKSLCYSIYYYLNYQELMKTLQFCQMDYHFFLSMKDRNENIMGSNQIYKCKICADDYHTLFECPHHHYIPMKQLIVSNYLRKQINTKIERNSIIVQRDYKNHRTLHNLSATVNGHRKYLKANFDDYQIKEIKNIEKYHYQKTFETLNRSQFSIQIKNRKKNQLAEQIQRFENIINKITCPNDNFWLLESDVANNFKYYFKEYNPNRLIKFNIKGNGKKVKDLVFGSFAFKKNQNQQIFSNFELLSNRSKLNFSLQSRQDIEQQN